MIMIIVNKNEQFLKKVALIAGLIAAVVVVAHGIYFLFAKNTNTSPTVQATLTVEEKMALLNALANASSTGAVSAHEQEKILNDMQKSDDASTITSDAEKMKVLDSLTQ